MSCLLLNIRDTGGEPIGSLIEVLIGDDRVLDARLVLDRGHDASRIRKCIGLGLGALAREISASNAMYYTRGFGWEMADRLREHTEEGMVCLIRTEARDTSADVRYWARVGKAREHLHDLINKLGPDAPSFDHVERAVNDLVMLSREAKSENTPQLGALLLCIRQIVGDACGVLATKHDKAFRLV